MFTSKLLAVDYSDGELAKKKNGLRYIRLMMYDLESLPKKDLQACIAN